MADKTITSGTIGWIDVYATSGIATGKGLIIQNQKNSAEHLIILERAAAPSVDLYEGRRVPYLGEVEVGAGSPGVWVRGNAGLQLFVQEV